MSQWHAAPLWHRRPEKGKLIHMPAPNRSIVDKRSFGQAMRQMNAFLPTTNWPECMVALFFGSQTLSYRQRLHLLTFLYGNGYPVDAIRVVLAPRMRTPASCRHAENVLKDLISSRYDSRWYYFNVVEADFLFLDGTPHGVPRGNQVYTRLVNAWDKHCWKRHFPSLKEQHTILWTLKQVTLYVKVYHARPTLAHGYGFER